MDFFHNANYCKLFKRKKKKKSLFIVYMAAKMNFKVQEIPGEMFQWTQCIVAESVKAALMELCGNYCGTRKYRLVLLLALLLDGYLFVLLNMS